MQMLHMTFNYLGVPVGADYVLIALVSSSL